MKKLLFVSGLLIVTFLALGLVGFAYAQTQTPPDSDVPNNTWMGGRGGHSGHMGGRWGRNPQTVEYGPMHEYMISAMAEVFSISPEELQERHNSGETMWQIAENLGYTQEQFAEMMLAAREKALKQAVSDGVITQEQADWFLERWNGMGGQGGGFGSCQGGQGGRGPGWRWNQDTTQPANPEA